MSNRLILFFLVFASAATAMHFTASNATTCACNFATVRIAAENLQAEPASQVIAVESPLFISPASFNISLEALEKKAYSVQAYASCGTQPGVYPVSFVGSEKQAFVKVKQCQGFSMVMTAMQSSCQNQHADFAVSLENLGDDARVVSISTDLNPSAYVLPAKVSLGSREKRSVVLSINTNTLPQVLPFKVVARSEDYYEEQPAVVDVRSCTGLRMDGPRLVGLVEDQSIDVALKVLNLGVGRSIKVESFCPPFVRVNASTVLLGSNQFATVLLDVNNAPSGNHTCSISAKSLDDNVQALHTLRFEVTPTRSRYTATPSEISMENGVITNVSFTLRNAGLFSSDPVSFKSPSLKVFSGPSKTQKREEQELSFLIQSNLTASTPGQYTQGGYRRPGYVLVAGNTTAVLQVGNFTHAIAVDILPPSILFNASVVQVDGGFRVDFVATNLGNETVMRFASVPASQGPLALEMAPDSQQHFSLFVPGNETSMVLEATTDRGVYRTRVDFSSARPSTTTGLVTFAAPVIAFGVAILLALTLLYLLYRRSKPSASGESPAATGEGQKTLPAYSGGAGASGADAGKPEPKKQ